MPSGNKLLGKNVLSGKYLKSIAQSLGNVANVRETAKFPQDRLIFQAREGKLKIIALSSHTTLVHTITETDVTYRMIVKSRAFLQLAKGLKAKDQVVIQEAQGNWQHGIAVIVNGKEHYLEHLGNELPNYMIRPVSDKTDAYIEVADIDVLTAGAEHLAAGYEPLNVVEFIGEIFNGGKKQVDSYISDNYRYGHATFSGTYQTFGCVDSEFVESLGGLGSGRFDIYETQATVAWRSEGVAAYGRYYHFDYRIPASLKLSSGFEHQVVVDRKPTINAIKDAMAEDELDKVKRVMVYYQDGTLKFGAPSLEYERNVNADYLLHALSATTDDKVGVGLRENPMHPIHIRSNQWQIEVMPLLWPLKEKSKVDRKISLPGIYVD